MMTCGREGEHTEPLAASSEFIRSKDRGRLTYVTDAMLEVFEKMEVFNDPSTPIRAM